MKGDLHCHTKLSDGSVGIEEIVMLAAGNGVEVISITDHDCMAGNVRAKLIGEKNGVKVIPGVEITCTDGESGKPVHMLCYSPEFPDRLEGLCHSNQTTRKKAGQIMMLKAKAKFGISADFIMKRSTGSTNLYKQHIMHALMEAGYTDSMYGELYRRLFIPGTDDYIGIQPKYPSPEEVLGAIHDAGGIAVLAHPALYGNFDLLKSLSENGLDGVEVYHPTASENDCALLLDFAAENGLIVTGGSDFHGLYNRTCLTPGSYGISGKQLEDFLGFKARKKRQQKKNEAKAVTAAAVSK